MSLGRIVHFYPLLLLLLWWAALRWRPGGRRSWLLLSGLLTLSLLSWPPLVHASFRLLEDRYPQTVPLDGVEAVVLLSGSMRQPDDRHPHPRLGPESYVRAVAAADLLRRHPQLPAVLAGGNVQPGTTVSLAAALRRHLLGEGIATERLWLEDRSRTTWENAVFSRRILADRGIQRIALVTEAYHMPRSVACFRAQGLEVVPVPCEFRSRRTRRGWTWLLPTPQALVEHERLLHEVVGSLYYRLRGRF